MSKISIVIPSRLQISSFIDADEPHDQLYVERAIRSVLRQSVFRREDWEIIVAVDSGTLSRLPVRFKGDRKSPPCRFVESHATGQAAAVNAGVQASDGDVVAFLEDDDVWAPEKMEFQLPLLGIYDFVSSNQREVNEQGRFERVNDFATPSGWLMKRETWNGVGPMNESFHFHVDSEWLGRLNMSGYKRIHVVEKSHEPPIKYSFRPRDGNWLSRVAEHSAIQWSPHSHPLVIRTVNPRGGTGRITRNRYAAALSEKEHAILEARFGLRPW